MNKKRIFSHTENIHGHDIKFYSQDIDGATYTVPTHVNRVDCDNAKGWQIRRIRKNQPKLDQFIPDRGFHDKEASLNAAVNALRIHLKNLTPSDALPFAMRESKKGRFKTGFPGITLAWEKKQKKRFYELFIKVGLGYYAPNQHKAFYVGTENTVDQERIDQRMGEAIEWRQKLIRDKIEDSKIRVAEMDVAPAKPHRVTLEQVEKLLKHKKKLNAQKQKDQLREQKLA